MAGTFQTNGLWSIWQLNTSQSFVRVGFGRVTEEDERWYLYEDYKSPDGDAACDTPTRFIYETSCTLTQWKQYLAFEHDSGDHGSAGHTYDRGIPHEAETGIYVKVERRTTTTIYTDYTDYEQFKPTNASAWPQPTDCPSLLSLSTTAEPAASEELLMEIDPGFYPIYRLGAAGVIGYLFVETTTVSGSSAKNLLEYWMLMDSDAGGDSIELGECITGYGSTFDQDVLDYFLDARTAYLVGEPNALSSVTVCACRYYECMLDPSDQ